LSGVKTLYTMISDGVTPDVWGFAMGTNDVGKYKTADEYATLIDQMLSMPDAKVPIIWVDVYNPNSYDVAGAASFHEIWATAGAPAPLLQLVQRLLAPEAAERPRDVREVREELARMHPAARRPLADRLRAVQVIGREKELARLEAWLADPPRQTRGVLISGEAGSGKTALLQELAARATLAGRGVAFLSFAAFEGPGAVGLAIVRRLASDLGAETSEIMPLTRALLHDSNVSLAEEHLDPIVAELASAAEALGKTFRPPLMLMDDIEHEDPVSRALIYRLLLVPGSPPMLAVAVRRGTLDDMEEREKALVATGVAQPMQLGPLDRESVERLAAARLNEPAPAPLVEFLWSRALGHAGLTVELLHAAAERGALRESEAGVVVDETRLDAIGVPQGFEASLLARLAALPEDARAAAVALAIWDRGVPSERALALEPRAGEAAIEALIVSGLARRDERGAVALAPPALGPRILDTVAPQERRALHRRAAQSAGLSAAERFQHLRGGGDADAALLAADEAFEHADDVRLASAAVALAEAEVTPQAGAWRERAGRALAARGRYADAIPHLERAVELADTDELRAVRRQLLSTAYLRAGRHEDVERVIAAALGDDPPAGVRSRLLSNESARLQASMSSEGARAAAEEALTLAETAGDDEAVGIAANTLAHALLMLQLHDRAEEMGVRAVEAFRRAGERVGEARALGTRATIAHARPDVPRADRLFQEALAAARKLGNRVVVEEVLLNHAVLLTDSGQWTRSRDAHSESFRIALEDGRARGAALALANLAQDDGLTGRPRSAQRRARAAIRLSRSFLPGMEMFAWRSLAQAHRIAGRLRRADRAARRALNLSMAASYGTELDWARIELGRVWMTAGRWDQAGELWDRAIAAPRAHTSVGHTVLLTLSGRAALRRQDEVAALERLTEAEQWLAGHESPYAAALANQLRAELAMVQGRPGEGVERARRVLTALGDLPAPADRALAALEFARLAQRARGETVAPINEWLELAAAGFERLGDRRNRERSLSATIDWLRRTGGAVGSGARERSLIESVSRLLHSLRDLHELTQRAMELAVEQFDAERGVLLLSDPETGRLTPMAEHGAVDAGMRRDAVTYSHRMVERVTESGRSLLIRDAPTDPSVVTESVQNLRLRSILCVPMYVGGTVVGALVETGGRVIATDVSTVVSTVEVDSTTVVAADDAAAVVADADVGARDPPHCTRSATAPMAANTRTSAWYRTAREKGVLYKCVSSMVSTPSCQQKNDNTSASSRTRMLAGLP
jgi:tetratricopeptide (TPR) repeat protein